MHGNSGFQLFSFVSGCAHGAFENDVEALNMLRELMTFLPQNNNSTTPRLQKVQYADEIEDVPFLDQIVPQNSALAYDILELIKATVDDRHFFEIMPDYAQNIVIGFARYNGHTVGVVGNQPKVTSGKSTFTFWVLIYF